jgi:hypothetical protein
MNKKFHFLNMMIVFLSCAGITNAQTPQIGPSQIICHSIQPADIVLSGTTAEVIKWQKAANSSFTDPIDIANTTTILTGASIGNLTETTWFRPVLDTFYPDMEPAKVEVGTVTTWNGTTWDNELPDSSTTAIFTGNYSSTESVDACRVLIINNANVIVNTNHTLTVQNSVEVTSGTLLFENNASLVQVSNVINSGNITYKRNTMMRKFDYTYWSSPVASVALNVFSPLTLASKFYSWNAYGTPSFGWTNLSGTSLMNPAQGYIIRGPETYSTTTLTPWTGEFTGVPNNGDYSINVYATESTAFNLLGNPYPSAISAEQFMDENAATMGEFGTTCYFWTHNTPITNNNYAYSDYAAYNRTGGIMVAESENNSIPTGNIAAGQGFMVKAITSGVATFTNQMRIAGNNEQFYRQNTNTTTSTEKHRLWLDFKNEQGQFKEILVGYITNATNEYEDGFDGPIAEAGNPVSFYSVNAAHKLSIQGRALPFTASDEVPLGYKTNTASTYTITLSQFDGLFAHQTVYLEDTLLQVLHNLGQSPYSFSTLAGTFDTRFVLRYGNSTLGLGDDVLNSDEVRIYKEQQQIVINTGTTPIQSVRVYDAAGRQLIHKESINAPLFKFNSTQANGLLLVQIKTDDNQLITKKIMQ